MDPSSAEPLHRLDNDGAGKTTLLKVSLGNYVPDAGTAHIFVEPSLTMSDTAEAFTPRRYKAALALAPAQKAE